MNREIEKRTAWLVREFGTSQIPLALAADRYFGLNESQAKERAAARTLPVPAYRVGSQKSPWFIDAEDLALLILQRRQAAAFAIIEGAEAGEGVPA